MSKLIAGIELAAVITTSPWAEDASKLVGLWNLHEVTSGKDVKLYGAHPRGSVALSRDARFVSTGFMEGRANLTVPIWSSGVDGRLDGWMGIPHGFPASKN